MNHYLKCLSESPKTPVVTFAGQTDCLLYKSHMRLYPPQSLLPLLHVHISNIKLLEGRKHLGEDR